MATFNTIADLVAGAKVDEMVSVNIHLYIEETQEYADFLKTGQSLYKGLAGSEKQITWAGSLREKMVKSLAYMLVKVRTLNLISPGKYDTLHNDVAFAAAIKRFRIVALQSQAAWYIEKQNISDQLSLMYKAASEAIAA